MEWWDRSLPVASRSGATLGDRSSSARALCRVRRAGMLSVFNCHKLFSFGTSTEEGTVSNHDFGSNGAVRRR